MTACPAKYRRAFYEAQNEVNQKLRPYGPRCLEQYFAKASAIETFVVYSKEADEFEGRHRMRGIVTVFYGFPINHKDGYCSVNLSFDASMAGWQNGDLAVTLEKALPPLPSND